MKLKEMSLKPIEMLLRVPSDDICVFCGSSDELWDYPQEDDIQDSTHVDYSMMLLSCFNIKLMDPSGCGALCETCVSRLRDAASFRAQVEAAGVLLQQAKEVPTTLQSPEHQPTVEDSPRPGQEITEIISDDDNLDTFCNDDSMNSDKEEDQKQNFQVFSEKLPWTDQEPLENNLKSENKGVKRIEWIDQRQYPKPSIFRVPILKLDSNECPVCDEVFPDWWKLHLHFEYHFPEFLCHLCGKVFAKEITFRQHLLRHKAKSFPCLRCWNKSYVSQSNLRQHEKTAHENKGLHPCPKCHIRFSNIEKRKVHLLKEHGVLSKQHICPECSRVYRSRAVLNKHVRAVHRKEKNVSCPECGAFFFGKKELARHSLSHSDIRNYICDICSKAFKQRKYVQTHLAIHYNIRNYKCSLCDAAFVQNTSLNVHMRSHHKNVLSNS